MRIEDYSIDVHISRYEMDGLCDRVITYTGADKLWNYVLKKHLVRFGCFDQHGKYFGNLGLEVESSSVNLSVNSEQRKFSRHYSGDYAHFNLRGVNPEAFGIYRQWQPGEFAPFMKHHPAIYKRVELIKQKCAFKNIHIHEDIDIQWGP